MSLGSGIISARLPSRQEVDSARGILERTDITDELIKDYIDYRPGGVYSLSEKRRSEDNLNRLGIFELRNYDLAVPDPSDTAITVPSSILYRPLDKHEVAPDLFVSDEDGAFNLGTGLQYTNRNFLGGARKFSTRLRFRTQTIGKFPSYFDTSSDAVANLELTFELLQPFLFSNQYKLTWSFSFVVDKQRPYIQNIVRNKVGVSGRLAEFTTAFLDWTLESATLTLNPTYPIDPTDPSYINAARLLEEGQLNSIISATLQRDKTNDLFSPTAGFVHSATVEESGIFPYVVKSFWEDVTFTQFYRVILSGRWYEDISLTRYCHHCLETQGGCRGEVRREPFGFDENHPADTPILRRGKHLDTGLGLSVPDCARRPPAGGQLPDRGERRDAAEPLPGRARRHPGQNLACPVP